MFNFIKNWFFRNQNKELAAQNEKLLNSIDEIYLSFLRLKAMDDILLKAIALQKHGTFVIEDEYLTTAEKDYELQLKILDNPDKSITISIEKVKSDKL